MMRVNLKVLGTALVAALALSAVAASSASAQEVKFTAESYPAVMTGHEEGEKTTNNFFRGTDGAILTCETVTYESTLEKVSTSLTVTPHYAGCQSHRGANHQTTNSASVTLNGCHFEFHAKNEHSNNETTVPGTADIECPDTSTGILIHISTCTIHLPEAQNQGLTGVTFTNEPGDETTPDPWVTVDVAIENQIHYEDTDGFLCPFEGNSTGENGDFFATVKAKGYKDVENVSHATTTGVTSYKHGESQGIDVKTTTE